MSRSETRRENIQTGRPMNEGIESSPADFLRALDRVATPGLCPECGDGSGIVQEFEAPPFGYRPVARRFRCSIRTLLPALANVVNHAQKIDRLNEQLKRFEDPNPDLYDDIQVAIREQHDNLDHLTAAVSTLQHRLPGEGGR